MGGWKLEAFKMGLYMSFPVGVFWWFNQPEFFEGWMMEKRKFLFPPEDPIVRETLQKTIDKVEMYRQNKLDAELRKSRNE